MSDASRGAVQKLRPLHGFVQVVDIPVPMEVKTSAGLVLQVKREPRLRFGRVVALGPGPDKKGRTVHHDVEVGEVVAFDCYSGNQFKDASYHAGVDDGGETSWRIVSDDQLLLAVGAETPEELAAMSVGLSVAHK